MSRASRPQSAVTLRQQAVESGLEAPGADRAPGPARGRRKAKISVTVDEGLWSEVHTLLEDGQAATSASAAVEHGLWLWVANQRLARALDATYVEDPAARPTEEEIARAAGALKL